MGSGGGRWGGESSDPESSRTPGERPRDGDFEPFAVHLAAPSEWKKPRVSCPIEDNNQTFFQRNFIVFHDTKSVKSSTTLCPKEKLSIIFARKV